jgi:cell division protein FtsW (lipid II flippase)
MTYVGYLALLLLGIAIFVFGLLEATHEPFQRWRYGTEWYNPQRKAPVDVNSDEYKVAIANMKIAGAKFAGVGGLMMLTALSALGLIH